MSKNVNEEKFYDYNSFELAISDSSNIVMIKVNNIDGNLEEKRKILKRELNKDYLDQSGVYFLQLEDGYYIGETKNLFGRFKQHITNKQIKSITFATYKSELDKLDKEDIRDIESILLEFAKDMGLTLGTKLTNTKNENRKKSNILSMKIQEKNAMYIWDKISYMNLTDLLDNIRISEAEDAIEEIQEAIQKKNQSINAISVAEISSGQKNILPKLNVLDHKVSKELPIFEHIPFREIPTMAYSKRKIEGFGIENAEKMLFMYLFQGMGNGSIDRALLPHMKRSRGWVTAATLAYYKIDTGGKGRGSLSDKVTEGKAKELIKELIKI